MSKEIKEGVEIDPQAKKQLGLYPLEQIATISKNFKAISIGIPKEQSSYEKRVVLRPEAVNMLVRNGHQIILETQAGLLSQFQDKDYSEAGAQIVSTSEEALSADIVLKVEPPTMEEIEFLKPGKTLISAIQLATLTPDFLKALIKKKTTAVAFELIKDRVGGIPVMRAMSEIAGSTVMLIAAEYLSSNNGGKGIILGGVTGVPPTKVVIIGAGTVAEYAARTALGLGAEIKIFDKHIYKLRRLKHAIGQEVFTCTLDDQQLTDAISRADVVIGAVRTEKGRSPMVVSEEMVASMKPNSVIIDVSIDQGGCFETSAITTLQNPTFKKYGVIHYCVPNIASRVALTSSTALSNIFAPYMLEIGETGGIDDMIFSNRWFMRGVYAYKGMISNEDIAKKFNLPYKDLGLLLASTKW
jgi:alanine dehydrogenase